MSVLKNESVLNTSSVLKFSKTFGFTLTPIVTDNFLYDSLLSQLFDSLGSPLTT